MTTSRVRRRPAEARRLILEAAEQLLVDGGPHAVQMRAVCSAEPLLENTSTAADGWVPRPSWRPLTKFERRARAEGRDVRDLVFRRVLAPHSFTHSP